jgi:hypothetical protein
MFVLAFLCCAVLWRHRCCVGLIPLLGRESYKTWNQFIASEVILNWNRLQYLNRKASAGDAEKFHQHFEQNTRPAIMYRDFPEVKVVRCSAFKWFLGFHKNYYTEVVGPCG